jgi:light-regulated signal transduction histidine kinase (bacteriophytochrome)
VGASSGENEWIFCVSDNGTGIDPKYQERIFGAFQRLHGKSEYGGTGLGLTICQKIVRRHDGRLWVESEPKRGARFYSAMPKEAYQRIVNKVAAARAGGGLNDPSSGASRPDDLPSLKSTTSARL